MNVPENQNILGYKILHYLYYIYYSTVNGSVNLTPYTGVIMFGVTFPFQKIPGKGETFLCSPDIKTCLTDRRIKGVVNKNIAADMIDVSDSISSRRPGKWKCTHSYSF